MAVALVAVAASLFVLTVRGGRAGQHPARAGRSVAVVGFRNVSARSDAAWFATAFLEMLTTELAVGEKILLVPGENVARMKRDLSLEDAEAFATDTLHRIRANLGNDLIVLGAYTSLGQTAGGRIRLDIRLQDVQTGEMLASVSETGTESDLFELITRVGARLRASLGVKERGTEGTRPFLDPAP